MLKKKSFLKVPSSKKVAEAIEKKVARLPIKQGQV